MTLPPDHDKFMQQAIDLATQNVLSGRGGPFGAVIVRAGEVIATGINLVTATNDPTAHAEVTAIRNACAHLSTFELRGATLYSSCEPCPMCLTAILWSRIDTLYFGSTATDAAEAGFDDSFFYQQVRLPTFDRDLPTTNILRTEALAPFNAWRTFTARIDY
ncbi:nucleoside deaminase [Granulicella tundricola]|uniref:CMP/dCMP deaminase zinc-binding protein n=1 Tax=Granulicella tundricola (strain ATCC BAA-1859 / DSM 23138 / MP5ACTX9) TaxID=1198114 RepID=E8WYX6_GRATM|nr:nucleoside deaminase [Granulicella tundricola]ADW69891.1 CMP/dCMP deaminase zinc-binding protein [Granulicella tundricola MP5ACTX9]